MDVKTLFFINILIAFFMGGAMLFYMRVQKTYRGFGWWAATALLAGVGYSMVMSRIFFKGPIGVFISFILANTIVSGLLLVRLQGVRKFFGRESLSRAYLLIPVSFLAVQSYFFYIYPDVALRTFALSIVISFQYFMIAWEFFVNIDTGSRKLNGYIIGMNSVFGLIYLARCAVILFMPGYSFLSNNRVDMLFFTILPLFEVAWNVCFIMLNNNRTYHELETAMEEKLLADEAVNTANADYREIFNSVNDAICIDDIATGVFVDVNKKMLDIYGYTPEEIITMNVGDLSPDEPGYRQEDTVDWRQKAIDGEPQTFEWKAKDKQGRVFWVEVSLKRAMLGGMDRLIAVVRNIDARKRAEDERKANEEKMQRVQKLESLGIMAGGIAHDFNNLLMVILGNIDMGMMSIPKDSQAAVNLKTAEKACESAADLTKQMLAYAGKGQFVVQRIDFNEIIREMDKVLRITISRKVSISYVLDEALPHVEADSGQMKQLVMNLVINASEAIGDNEGSISVMTGSAFPDEIQGKETILMSENLKDGRFVFLEVSDTGGGIDEDVLPRIFDPFFTTKFVGRGLGLAAVMGIVKNAGGAIKIENRKGEGAGFTLYIPACADDGLPGKRGHERSYGSKVALIVDDENDVIEIGTQMLGLLGYKSLTARNGAEAVRILRENVRNAASGDERISIILLDIGMPVIGGEEAFEEIMRIDRTIPVFISSGYGEVEIARRFMNKNIAGFLNKPYTFENLKKVFEDYFKE